MNDFIQFRKNYLTQSETNAFPFAYLEKFERTQDISKKESKIIKQLKDVFELTQKDYLVHEEMNDLLFYLGNNEYLNAAIVELFLNNQNLFRTNQFGEEIINRLSQEKVSQSAIYALLDTCIEVEYNIVSEELLNKLLEKKSLTLDNFSLIIDYLHHFKIINFEPAIYKWLGEDFPITIKIQLIDLLVELDSIQSLNNSFFEKISFSKAEQQLIDEYIYTIPTDNNLSVKGFTVLQAMFYGDFENSGKGNNGGLAIFLKALGAELSKSKAIEKIVTMAITNQWLANQKLIKSYSASHFFIKIPIYIDKSKPTDFLKKERLIKRTIKRFLERLAIEPDIYHIRYLDNASRAVAHLSREEGRKLVLTLAPDPHRNMANQAGSLIKLNFTDFIDKLNKIMIGNQLIDISDKIVGIGNRVVQKELNLYFPQLLNNKHQQKVHMISEGIQTDIDLIKRDQKGISNHELALMKITPDFFEKPIILNVGRLNKLKAQDQLLKAWGNSDLSNHYNLLIIGGDLENPNFEETEMMELFKEYMNQNKHLKENFIHLGALSNYKIRKVERKIRAAQKDYPQIYLCSSKKEEFGIAILEALSQQLLVFGPEKGGVKSYLKHGVNGFLIDTMNWQSIAKDVTEIVLPLKNKNEYFENIQSAGEQTVKEHFSLAVIAEDFLSLYLSLQEKE